MKIKMNKYLIIVAIVVLVLILLTILVVILNLPLDPLAQFITRRQCSFVEFGDLHAAACTDGTQWTVGPFP